MKLKNLTDDQYINFARLCVANWKNFESFSWYGGVDNPDNYYMHYTSHRDSGLLDQANEQVIVQHFKDTFRRTQNLNWQLETHKHFAYGYADCITIRVYKRNGQITREFKELAKIVQHLHDDHHILDESVYDELVNEQTIKNIDFEGYRFKNDYDLPENWANLVAAYWYDNNSDKLSNTDDQGGWLSTQDIEIALRELKLI